MQNETEKLMVSNGSILPNGFINTFSYRYICDVQHKGFNKLVQEIIVLFNN